MSTQQFARKHTLFVTIFEDLRLSNIKSTWVVDVTEALPEVSHSWSADAGVQNIVFMSW